MRLRKKQPHHYPSIFKLVADGKWKTTCPACTSNAFLAGMEFDEEVMEETPGDEGWEEQVQKNYGAEEFRCPTCDLHLDSRQEIEAARVEADHSEVETRVREYEPDYGNC
jgi:hypothetical protein